MSDTFVLDLVIGMLTVATKLAAPILLTSLVIGVVVSLAQVITQIQEMTLTFVPKVIGIVVVLVVSGPWMINELVGWVTELWQLIPSL